MDQTINFHLLVAFLFHQVLESFWLNIHEPPLEKTNNLGFQPGPTKTRLYCHRSRLEA